MARGIARGFARRRNSTHCNGIERWVRTAPSKQPKDAPITPCQLSRFRFVPPLWAGAAGSGSPGRFHSPTHLTLPVLTTSLNGSLKPGSSCRVSSISPSGGISPAEVSESVALVEPRGLSDAVRVVGNVHRLELGVALVEPRGLGDTARLVGKMLVWNGSGTDPPLSHALLCGGGGACV